MAIADKLTQLNNAKLAIKEGLQSKLDLNLSSTPFTDYATQINTITNQGAQTKTFTPSTSSQSYTIPKGYHNGSGKVTCNAIGSAYANLANATILKTSGTKVSSLTLAIDSSKYKVISITLSANYYQTTSASVSATISGTSTTLSSSNGAYLAQNISGSGAGRHIIQITWVNTKNSTITQAKASNLWSDDGCAVLSAVVVSK